jgi:hypothetical protein
MALRIYVVISAYSAVNGFANLTPQWSPKTLAGSFSGTFSQIFVNSPFIRLSKAIYSSQFQMIGGGEKARPQPQREAFHGGRAEPGD